MILILGTIVNINWRGMHDHLMSMRFFTLIMNKIFIRALKSMESGYGFDLI